MPRIKSSQYLFYIPNEKKMLSLKVFFIFDRLFTKLKIIHVNGASSLQLSRSNYRAIDYAPGHSHFSGHSYNYARSFNQSDDRNLPIRYIKKYTIMASPFKCKSLKADLQLTRNIKRRCKHCILPYVIRGAPDV